MCKSAHGILLARTARSACALGFFGDKSAYGECCVPVQCAFAAVHCTYSQRQATRHLLALVLTSCELINLVCTIAIALLSALVRT